MANFVNEIIHVAEAVAKEKGVSKNVIMDIIKEAIHVSALKKYGNEYDLEVKINHYGEINILRNFIVVNDGDLTDRFHEIEISEANASQELFNNTEEIAVGNKLTEVLPPVDIDRVVAQGAKQIIVNKIKDAEREKQYNEMKGYQGRIITVLVKRIERGNIICLVNSTVEAILPKRESIKGEILRINERIKVYVQEVKRDFNYQVVLSRACNEFLYELLKAETPEIAEGLVHVHSISRDPGLRSKISVYTNQRGIDPVGACIGVNGSRMSAISKELNGERIDVLLFSEDISEYVSNTLSPATIQKVNIVDENNIEVVMESDQVSLAIGKGGQNIRLATKLLGTNIEILSTEGESQKRKDEFNVIVNDLMDKLEIDDVIAHLLISENINSIDDILNNSVEQLATIEGFDIEIAQELFNRAQDSKTEQEKIEIEGIDSEILALPHMNNSILKILKKENITNLDSLGDLARDELIDLIGSDKISIDQANEIIMKAREHWFKD